MMKTISSIALSVGLLLPGVVLAQSNAAINTTESDLSQSPLDYIIPDRVSHFSQIAGPSVDGNSNPRSFDGTLDTDGINSWHQVSFGWDINDRTRFVVNPRFVLEESQNSEGRAIGRLDNPVAGITSTWYQSGNFTFAGGLNTVIAVVTEDDREDGLEWNPGGFQAANYKVNDLVDVGTWLWARYRYYRNNAENSRAPIFVSPYVTYKNTDKLATQIFYQVNGEIAEADRFLWDPDEHLNFSVIYNINDKLSVQPILTVFRETNFSTSDGNINLWVSGRFF